MMTLQLTGRSFGMPTLAGIAVFAASPALAHHPLGGETPATALHGLFSGVGHPMLGIDHFAFICAMAFAAVAMGRLASAPLAFLLASATGVMLAYWGVSLPLVEIVVAGSAVLVGALVLSGRELPLSAALGLFAFAGLFHGHAYGGAIIGAESTPLLAYITGLTLTQYAIALAAGTLARTLWNGTTAASVNLRVAGAVTAGIGGAFLFENIEGLIFPVVG